MSTPNPPMSAEAPHVDEALVTYTHVIYALHALAVVIGITTMHTIVGSFVGGLPSIIAVIMNYARRPATPPGQPPRPSPAPQPQSTPEPPPTDTPLPPKKSDQDDEQQKPH